MAVAWSCNSLGWGMISGCLSGAAIAVHTMAVITLAGLVLFWAIELLLKKAPMRRRALFGYAATGLPLMLLSSSIALWALWGFPAVADRSATPAGNARTIVYETGLSVSIMAIAGWLYAWRGGDWLDRMSACVAAVAAAAALLAPIFVPFPARYFYLSALPIFLLAGGLLAKAAAALAKESRLLGVGLCVAVLIVPLPSFVS
jgi:hypothetical protein